MVDMIPLSMKLLALTALLCFLSLAVSAQEYLEPPACRPDLKMVIEILADYSLEHQSAISGGQYWGLTDIQRRKIYVSDEPDATYRRMTVLHEMVHICYHTKAVGLPHEIEEVMADRQARELYAELFGK